MFFGVHICINEKNAIFASFFPKGLVVQWIEYQIPVLTMRVRFSPSSQKGVTRFV